MNTNPDGTSAVTGDTFNPAVQYDVLHDDDFAAHVARRVAARLAFMRADAGNRLRRALLRRHSAIRMPIAVGPTHTIGQPDG